jgi:hypothetical protein
MGKKKFGIKEKTVIESITELFNKGENSDCTIKTEEGKTFPLHKAVLSTLSGFFKENLKNSNEITVNEDSNTFKAFLEFCYNGKINLKEEDLFKFLELCHKVSFLLKT